MLKLKQKTLQAKAKSKCGFTLIEILAVLAIVAILAAIAIPQFAAYQRRGFQERVFAAAKLDEVWITVLRTLREEKYPIEIEDREEGHIETGWIEYAGDTPRGVLKIKWQERKKVIIELNRKLSPKNVSLRVDLVIEEKPPNSSWTRVNDGRIQEHRSRMLNIIDKNVFRYLS